MLKRSLTEAFYHIRPVVPRRMQIYFRRRAIARKRARYSHIWPIDRKAGLPPDGWPGWPDKKKFALVLTHDVETATGQDKCYDLANMDVEMGFRSSFNFVPERYDVSQDLRNFLVGNGFEVGVHKLKH